jgi:hypothetical protein
MSVILDIDLDYFRLFKHPMREWEQLLGWASRPVDFVVKDHHQAFTRWQKLVNQGAISSPSLIIHADEHHDMLSESPPVQFGNFPYFALRQWPECRVHWLTAKPIDHPDMWLSQTAWHAISSRFSSGSKMRREWPKPDLVSVCTSPGFVDEKLSRSLLERIEKRGG